MAAKGCAAVPHAGASRFISLPSAVREPDWLPTALGSLCSTQESRGQRGLVQSLSWRRDERLRVTTRVPRHCLSVVLGSCRGRPLRTCAALLVCGHGGQLKMPCGAVLAGEAHGRLEARAEGGVVGSRVPCRAKRQRSGCAHCSPQAGASSTSEWRPEAQWQPQEVASAAAVRPCKLH